MAEAALHGGCEAVDPGTGSGAGFHRSPRNEGPENTRR